MKQGNQPPSQDDWQSLSEWGRIVITLYVLSIVYRTHLRALRALAFAALALAALPSMPEHPMRLVVALGWAACALYVGLHPHAKTTRKLLPGV